MELNKAVEIIMKARGAFLSGGEIWVLKDSIGATPVKLFTKEQALSECIDLNVLANLWHSFPNDWSVQFWENGNVVEILTNNDNDDFYKGEGINAATFATAEALKSMTENSNDKIST